MVDCHSSGDEAEVADFAVIRLVFGLQLDVLFGLFLEFLYLLLVEEAGVGVFSVAFKVLECDHFPGF